MPVILKLWLTFLFHKQGAALSVMVGWMTFGKKKFENLDSTMRILIPPIHQVMIDLIPLVDADANAFNTYMVRFTESFAFVTFHTLLTFRTKTLTRANGMYTDENMSFTTAVASSA